MIKVDAFELERRTVKNHVFNADALWLQKKASLYMLDFDLMALHLYFWKLALFRFQNVPRSKTVTVEPH